MADNNYTRKEIEMSLVIDTLRISTITEELTDAEIEIFEGLFDVLSYKSGELIVQPGDNKQPDNLYILAQGEIQVKIQSSDGETVIHVLKPGDLAGIITFVGGAPSQHSAALYSVSNTKVLSMPSAKFDALVCSRPMTAHKVMRGIVRYVHGIVRHMNAKSSELKNYIYRNSGGY
jgi:CRP/FNR family transcriptional regulator, cyclic AMP receptor protein